MTKDTIIESRATGAEVERIIVDKILPPLQDENTGTVVIALLTLAMTIMKPDITSYEIQEGVKGASEWICLFLSEEAKLPDAAKRILN